MIEITIDMNRIPKNVGYIKDLPHGQQLILESIHELKKWILNKIQLSNVEKTIIIRGPMNNCIAVQVGIILTGHGTVVYQSPTGYERELI